MFFLIDNSVVEDNFQHFKTKKKKIHETLRQWEIVLTSVILESVEE